MNPLLVAQQPSQPAASYPSLQPAGYLYGGYSHPPSHSPQHQFYQQPPAAPPQQPPPSWNDPAVTSASRPSPSAAAEQFYHPSVATRPSQHLQSPPPSFAPSDVASAPGLDRLGTTTASSAAAPTPDHHPMAAPVGPQTPNVPNQKSPPNPKNGPSSSASLTAPMPPPPSPGSVASRDQTRINLLLEINILLLEEVNRLQADGQGGATTLGQSAQLRAAGHPDKMASEEYIQCLRRVQANLAYLMPKAQKEANASNPAAAGGDANQNQQQQAPKQPPGPAFMTPPPNVSNGSDLKEKYDQLKEVFPGWPGLDHRASASNASPRPGGTQGPFANGLASSPTSTSTTYAGASGGHQ